MIASRLKVVLENVVDNDQTGFLKGRSIAENISLINNVISYTESKNIPGLLLFVDFEKAFDTIEWAFIERTFHHFGFGSSFIKWINLFYCDIQSCVINNGWSTGFFELGRGVSTRPERSQKKWLRDCEIENVENLDWESIYLLPRLCTVSTKLRNFQFKFLHRKIATNSFLYKIKLSETNLCCFCQTAQETLLHLF